MKPVIFVISKKMIFNIMDLILKNIKKKSIIYGLIVLTS